MAASQALSRLVKAACFAEAFGAEWQEQQQANARLEAAPQTAAERAVREMIQRQQQEMKVRHFPARFVPPTARFSVWPKCA